MRKIEDYNAEKLSPETMGKIEAMINDLKNDGGEFDFRETADEYVADVNGSEYHFAKLEQFPLKGAEGISWVPLVDAIKAQLLKVIKKNPSRSLPVDHHSDNNTQ